MHVRKRWVFFTLLKLHFVAIFMLWACSFVIFNVISVSTNTVVQTFHASFIVHFPNEQSVFTIITELQYLTNYNT